MKTKTLFALTVLMTLPVSAQAAGTLTGCAAKQHNIERQIKEAETQGNAYRVEGLQKAWAEQAANCTDASLKEAREADVREKQRKVSEREEELQEAKASGRMDKVAKKQAKLDEAREELREAERALTK